MCRRPLPGRVSCCPLRTQLRRAPYFPYGGVGSIPTVRSNIEAGASSSSGPSPCPYSPECVEGEFCELRLSSVPRTSPSQGSSKLALQQVDLLGSICLIGL